MTERIQELEITAGVYLVRLAPSGEYVAEHDGRETAPLHHTDVAEIRAMVAAGNGGDVEFAFDYPIDGDDADEADNACDCAHKRPNGCNARCDRT